LNSESCRDTKGHSPNQHPSVLTSADEDPKIQVAI
jgi:hypothetical protein